MTVHDDSQEFKAGHEGSLGFMRMHWGSWRFVTIHDSSRRFITAHADSWQIMKIHDNSYGLMTVHESSWWLWKGVRLRKVRSRVLSHWGRMMYTLTSGSDLPFPDLIINQNPKLDICSKLLRPIIIKFMFIWKSVYNSFSAMIGCLVLSLYDAMSVCPLPWCVALIKEILFFKT